MSTLLIVGATLVLPFTPLAEVFGFVPLPISFLWLIGVVVVTYIVAAENARTIFVGR